MKIFHRISVTLEPAIKNAFSKAGMPLEGGFVSFDIEETDERWPDVEKIVHRHQLLDIITTKFSEEEISNSEYLAVEPTWHNGYPQPDGDFGYLEKTYDLKEYCCKCGQGKVQAAPFRLKKPPNWGRRSVFQLNWVFDEYFVRTELWENAFRPHGIGCRPVVLHKTGEAISSVVQLEIEKKFDVGIPKDAPREVCPNCRRDKILPITRGFLPRPLVDVKQAMFKSSQYFGSGGSAFRKVFVSSSLFNELRLRDVKGVDFSPCLPSG
ncbi:hypothetical protein [Roseibium aggregatum]|uniref:Uncharacterized protein n=1 Tax=Roseibium aggregatum TaxID=187304 RepID=A0A926P119_9HYPH|nr:hypothetical protein [Roseibium aggregatum]MBD1547458.1 hypothetical protein [Roseibium aggregatum]